MIAPLKAQKRFAQTHKPGDAFETHFDYIPIEGTLDGQIMGALLVSETRNRQRLSLTFVFESDGIHPTTGEEMAEQQLRKLERGLAALPQGERLRLHATKFPCDQERQAVLSASTAQTDNKVVKLYLCSEKTRLQQLTGKGLRQSLKLYFYATWSLGSMNQAAGPIERFLCLIENWVEQLQPQSDDPAGDFHRKLCQAFDEGFQTWLNIFSRMDLPVRPLSAAECMQQLNRTFQTDSTALSHCLHLTEEGVVEEVNSQRAPATLLTKNALPEAYEDYVQINDCYIGALTMLDKPSGWESAYHQLSSLFQVLAQAEVKETDLFVEFSAVDTQQQKLALQLLNRQANTSIEKAGEQNANDVQSMFNAEQSTQAQYALIAGAVTIKVGCTVLIQRRSRAALAAACNRFISHVPYMAREPHYAAQAFLQTLPVTAGKLQVYPPFDQRMIYLSNEATGLLPVLKPRCHDKEGLELVTEEGNCPLWIDFFNVHPLYGARHGGIFGQTRSGKSVLAASILMLAMARQMPITVIDYPRPDGTSTFTDFASQAGGAYFNVQQEAINILDIPDLSGFSEAEQAERFAQYQNGQLTVLMEMVVGETPGDQLPGGKDSIKAVLQLAQQEFAKDACIADRFRQAHRDGPASIAWQRMPTLHDFVALLEPDLLGLTSETEQKALAYCQLQLRSWLQNPGVGRAISRPSTIQSDASLVVYALTNVTDEREMAVMALSANLMAMQRSLAAAASLFFIDESPILMQYEQVSLMVGRLCANGGKAGIRVLLSGQDPDTIATSKAGPQIMQNLSVTLIGRIQNTAVESFARHLGIPASILRENAAASFLPNPQQMYSNWLVVEGGTFTRCRFYPSAVLLALTANNTNEQRARTTVLEHFHEQPLEGLAVFSRLLTHSIQSGESLDDVITTWLQANAAY
ncbi:hypothetical protein PN498_13245 [Oscillatoria sp. CS-180]|uniref:hypothetical protein n=1 Tax=Oscillatoria sp. CS-180 TaxID=3021720 RepID=UPI00232B6C84|nr:hypothetical protein [Oscillatoria sp. CS-180]MDB9526959.1 hypothetical protein [Oscillatoria sp. CS-180]